ncbi:hypothetical protein [Lyngbya sp. PCC 8106]|nr:hypothetical protein [Lyngbya sp. PCC 8106]
MSIDHPENIVQITTKILAKYFTIQKVCERLGLTLNRVLDEGTFRVEIEQ